MTETVPTLVENSLRIAWDYLEATGELGNPDTAAKHTPTGSAVVGGWLAVRLSGLRRRRLGEHHAESARSRGTKSISASMEVPHMKRLAALERLHTAETPG